LDLLLDGEEIGVTHNLLFLIHGGMWLVEKDPFQHSLLMDGTCCHLQTHRRLSTNSFMSHDMGSVLSLRSTLSHTDMIWDRCFLSVPHCHGIGAFCQVHTVMGSVLTM